MTTLVLALFLGFFAAEQLVELGLALLNLRHVARAGAAVPAPLAGAVDRDTARRSTEYTLARGRVAVAHLAFDALLTLLLLFSGFLPWLDALLARAGISRANAFVVFLLALSVVAAVAQLPWTLYSTFVLEQRFGFNRTSFALWLKDQVKGLLLGTAIGVPLLYALYGFFALTGPRWWIWLFFFLAGVQIDHGLAVPDRHRAALQPVRAAAGRAPPDAPRDHGGRAGFRTRGLFVMDASRRSGHSNAYFTGFFRPRIVLFDTLVQQMSVDEAAAVLAHEIGHYRARHVHKRLVFGLAVQLGALGILSLLVRWPPLFEAFGFASPSFHAALALASLCGGAFTFFFSPLESLVSRRHEYEADRESVRIAGAPAALRSALVKLNGQNLSNLHPHPLYSAWHYSHPTLLERLSAIRER